MFGGKRLPTVTGEQQPWVLRSICQVCGSIPQQTPDTDVGRFTERCWIGGKLWIVDARDVARIAVFVFVIEHVMTIPSLSAKVGPYIAFIPQNTSNRLFFDDWNAMRAEKLMIRGQ